MPQEIGRDEQGVTYRSDDGSTFTIPWDALVKMGGVSVEDAAYRIEGKRTDGRGKALDVARETLRAGGKDPGQDPFRGYNSPTLEEIFGRGQPAPPTGLDSGMPRFGDAPMAPWEQYPRQSPNEATHVPQAPGEPRVLKQLERNHGDLAMRSPRAEDKGYSQTLLSTPGAPGVGRHSPATIAQEAVDVEAPVPTMQPDVLPSTPEERIVSGYADQADAQRRAGEYEQQAGKAEAEGVAATAVQREETAKRLQLMHEQARAATDVEMQQFSEKVEAVRNTRIDPEHWFKSRSTGQKIAAGLAMAMAGVLNGVEGVNRTASMISQQIDMDLMSQRENIANLWQGLQAEAGILDRKRAGRIDDREAFAAVREVMHNAVADGYRAQAMGYRSEATKAQSEMLAAQIDTNGQKTRFDIDQQKFKNNIDLQQVDIARDNARSQRISAGATARNARTNEMATKADIAFKGLNALNETLGLDPQSRAIRARAGGGGLDPKTAIYGTVVVPDGKGGYVTHHSVPVGSVGDQTDRRAVQEFQTNYNSWEEGSRTLIREARQLERDFQSIKKIGDTFMANKLRSRLNTIHADLLNLYIRANEGGRPSDADREWYLKNFNGPASLTGPDSEPKIRALLERKRSQARNLFRDKGINYDPTAYWIGPDLEDFGSRSVDLAVPDPPPPSRFTDELNRAEYGAQALRRGEELPPGTPIPPEYDEGLRGAASRRGSRGWTR